MKICLSRREALLALAAMAGSVATVHLGGRPGFAQAAAPARRTRLILLGTDGGPRPKKTRFAPAQVILVDGVPYVIDCGNGVSRQLVLAGVPLGKLRYVFVTHHHSDHNADYGTLLLLSWASGLKTPVDTYGPPPLAKMTELALELNRYDIDTRIEDEGRVPLAPLIHPHELAVPGLVMQDERVKVTCALANHPPVKPAFSYRFDTADRSIVISGDTTYSESVIQLAKGADVLVHEALMVSAVDRLIGFSPNASRLKEHIIASHTPIEEVGKVATQAGVKTLVLSHFVPGEDPAVTEQMWIDGARKHFSGEIIVGRDLLEI
jgi:ribonuclease BN (tRNA processing enzyme)